MKKLKEKKQKEINKIEYLGNKEEVKLNSEKIRKRDLKIKILKMGLLISSLFLIIIYFLLRALYENGSFTISIDQAFSRKTGLVAYEHLDEKDYKILLEAQNLEFVDNISVNWIPKDIDEVAEGSHNGENYMAYTFYVQNMGQSTVNYWYSIPIDDVTKNADVAIRIMVFLNGEKTIYAKEAADGGPEDGTEIFFSNDIVCVEERENFEPGAIDKFTVVVWIEGDDPECLDDIIGGRVKMHMDITEEQIHEK
jgi:hypothetical protein